MKPHANRPRSGAILRIRSERQAIDDVESLGTLQTIHESHDAAIVAVDGGIDAHLNHAAVFDFLLRVGKSVNLKAGFFRDFIEFGSDRRKSQFFPAASDCSNLSQSFRVAGILSLMSCADLMSPCKTFELEILRVEFRLRCLRRGGQLPTVDGQPERPRPGASRGRSGWRASANVKSRCISSSSTPRSVPRRSGRRQLPCVGGARRPARCG